MNPKDWEKFLINQKQIGDMLHYTIYNLIYPLENQNHIGEGKDFWCSDWWTIEVLKCFYIGKDRYMSDPIPRRLEGNKNFSRQKIIEEVQFKLELISKIEEIKDNYDSVYISMIGRGVDVLLIGFLKKWKKIWGSDDHDYEQYLKGFFKDQNIVFFNTSDDYTFNQIKLPESLVILNGENL